ncbi:hypothetical protein CYY_008562 [Polysphondylium violaceum]|uniref:asparaginase n=1 Tax=Polysphondylium violaceum TaxID=133409 RepID=A0A8J4PLI2_9MYCE|nr:hypothetical protein CYY_008562 [Polysphondylium violaceum]
MSSPIINKSSSNSVNSTSKIHSHHELNHGYDMSTHQYLEVHGTSTHITDSPLNISIPNTTGSTPSTPSPTLECNQINNSSNSSVSTNSSNSNSSNNMHNSQHINISTNPGSGNIFEDIQINKLSVSGAKGPLHNSLIKMNRGNIFIIYTGGTLGMKRDPISGALRPEPHYLEEQLSALPEMKSLDMPVYTLTEFNPPIDSSDMEHEDWVKIAKLIEQNYYDYDGFVVLHGTDTMAYTASALSFMLENLGKPVVFTGSQIPFAELINDARRNLLTAIIFAGKVDLPEVCIFFNNQLLRGCRSRKVDSWSLDAFDSPNCPPLATLGMEINVNYDIVLNQPKGRFRVHEEINKNIAVVHLVPGFSDDTFENILSGKIEGLILQSYGSGNAPAKKSKFLQSIQKAVQRGVIVVVTSQCLRGSVNLKQYATGKSLLDAGAISGFDMTIETAATKLGWLLGRGLTKEQVKILMETDLRGELTKKVNKKLII